MKIRMDFVTNSSSSSYVFWGFYSKELMIYLKELINRGLVYYYNEHSNYLLDKDHCATNDLSFFPYYRNTEKTGFQIEEVKDRSHENATDALLSYINLDSLPGEEALSVVEKINELVKDAEDNRQILFDIDKGMTNDINHHFNEADEVRTVLCIEEDYILGCENKQQKKVDFNHFLRGTKFITKSSFKNMDSLECFSINAELDEIQANAFAGCSQLRIFRDRIPFSTITEKYPDFSYISANKVLEKAFKNCKSLSSIVFNGTKKIENSVFEGCKSLSSIVFTGVKKIETGTFEGCESLETVVFDNEIKQIESLAFSGCIALKDVFFEESPLFGMSLTKIAPDAFKNCTDVVFHVTEDTYAHRYAVRNKIRYELTKRLPRSYEVKKMKVKESKMAENLSINESLYLKYIGTVGCHYELEVFNSNEEKLGVIYENSKLTVDYIKRNIDNIAVSVEAFIPLSQIRVEKPKANSAYLKINLKLRDV